METEPPAPQGSMHLVTALALIVMGGLLILGPLLAKTCDGKRDKDRIAEFFTRNGNAAVLPYEMKPSGYADYDWACFIAGALMVWIGIRRSRLGKTPGMPIKDEKRQ